MQFSKKLFDNFSRFFILNNDMSDLLSEDTPKYDDDVMECLQFGICSSPYCSL